MADPPTAAEFRRSRWLGYVGQSPTARLGSAMIAVGLLVLVYAGLWQVGLAPGSRVTVEEPLALARAGGGRQVGVEEPATAIEPAHQKMPDPVRAAGEGVESTHAAPPARDTVLRVRPPAPLIAADRADRIEAASRPHPGYAVRLAIPAIGLDTEVRQAGVTQNQSGEWEWETLPFVAAHYGDLTSLIGAPGNAVISGHVVTLNEGNVFRSLYKVDLGSEIQVWDHRDQLHSFHVVQVKLVPPSDISALEPTPNPTLTLITCGGTFDPVRREFSDRLVVVARPTHSSP
jgi:LPXTG-site transpeptidase (sortase) family protein